MLTIEVIRRWSGQDFDTTDQDSDNECGLGLYATKTLTEGYGKIVVKTSVDIYIILYNQDYY